MFKSLLGVIIASAAFLVGLSAASVLNLRSDLPEVEVDFGYRQPNTEIKLTGVIQIERVIVARRNEKEATFKVTNRTRDPIHYSGYSSGDNALAWIRQDGKVSDALDLECWNGVEPQVLEPTQSTYFTIPIPRNGRPFDAGFDFRTGTRTGWQTVWVKVGKRK
jgi:hypothetical protein